MIRSLSSPAQLLGRLLMAWIFIEGGIGKFGHHDPFVHHLGDLGVIMPEIAYWAVVLVEFVGGICVLVGLQTRIVSLGMAVYCVLTAFIAHYHPGDVGQMTHFAKNVCMAGGFLQLFAVGAGGWSVDALFSRRG